MSLFRLSTHGMVPRQRRVSRLFQTVLGGWTPAKRAPIPAAQQAAAVGVEVGPAPSIHVVSCCFKACHDSPWCMIENMLEKLVLFWAGGGGAASLLRQLTVKGIEAV